MNISLLPDELLSRILLFLSSSDLCTSFYFLGKQNLSRKLWNPKKRIYWSLELTREYNENRRNRFPVETTLLILTLMASKLSTYYSTGQLACALGKINDLLMGNDNWKPLKMSKIFPNLVTNGGWSIWSSGSWKSAPNFS